MSSPIIRPGSTFSSELLDGSRLGEVVFREFQFLYGQLDDVLTSIGVNESGTINNLTVNNLTVTNVNGSSTTSGLLLRATRTLDNNQIKSLPSLPLAMLSPSALGIAPGAGYALNPIRCDWNLKTSNGAYTNVASDAYLHITYGSDTTPFGPSLAAAQLIPSALGIQGVFEGMFEPSTYAQDIASYENLAFYVWLFNSLGDLTGGGTGNQLIVNVYYVVTPVTSATATNTIVYTTSVRKVTPSAATRISITPSSTSLADSAWVEVTASAPADWAPCAIAFDPAVSGVYFAFDLGVGAAGSEVVIATISGSLSQENTCLNHRVPWQVPVSAVTTGDRVAIRMRKSGTDVNTWAVAIEYFETPMTGNAVVATVAPRLLGGGDAIVGSATDDAYSLWSHQTSDTPITTDLVVSGLAPTNVPVYVPYELTMGTGGNGAETDVYVQRAQSLNVSALGAGGIYYQLCIPMPTVRANTSLAFRLRKDLTSTASWYAQLTGYPGQAFPLLTSDLPMTWYPDPGAWYVSLAYGGSPWANGAYTVLFTATQDMALTASIVNIVTSTNNIEIDFATGAPGAEVVVARTRIEHNCLFNGWIAAIPFVIARNISAGDIVSARRRSSNSSGVSVSVGYIENPDFYQRRDTVDVCYPSAANAVSVAGNTTAWNNSNYVEVVSATATAVYLTILNYTTTLTNIDVEIDLATGAASSETVIGTFTTHIGNSSGGGIGQIVITPPLLVATGTRIAARFRKTGTSATGLSFSCVAVPVS